MKEVKISCVIPACGRTGLLLEAVTSVLRQTFQACEIIIVNNGESGIDLPGEILKRAAVYNIVPRAGASQARNFGASLARGEYLAFLDDDDLWGPAYLENAAMAAAGGALCIVSRLDKMVNGRVRRYKDAGDNLTVKNLLTHNPGVTGSNIVIAKKLFFNVRGFDAKLSISEDKSLLIELLKRGVKIKTLSSNQAIYREHNGNFFGTNPAELAGGIYCFTKKYSRLMGPKEYLFNWLKIYKNRYGAGRKTAIPPFIFLKLLFIFIKKLKI